MSETEREAAVGPPSDGARPKVDGRPPVLGGRRPAPSPPPPAPQRAATPDPPPPLADEPVQATATLPPPAPPRDAAAPEPEFAPIPRRAGGSHRQGAAFGVPVRGSRIVAEKLADRPSGRRRIPAAPEPPFSPCEDGPYRWEVTLPSAIGSTVTIRVGPDGLELGGQAVRFEEVASVRFRLEVEAALLRRAASARMQVAIRTEDGGTVKAVARNAASARRAEAIVTTLGYLWDVLGDTAGPRQRANMVEKIERGGEVVAGSLRLTRIGVAAKRRKIEHWSTVGDPVVEKRKVIIPTATDPIEVSIATDDSYVLPALIPELRSRYG